MNIGISFITYLNWIIGSLLVVFSLIILLILLLICGKKFYKSATA